jgi:hypothetical protein
MLLEILILESKTFSKATTMSYNYREVFVNNEIRRKAGLDGKSNCSLMEAVAGQLQTKCLNEPASYLHILQACLPRSQKYLC